MTGFTLRIPEYYNDLVGSVLAAVVLIASIFISGDAPLLLEVVGIACLMVTPFLWVFALLAFRKYGDIPLGKAYFETQELVTNGIFALVRHPQYLAYMLLAVGFSFLSNHWLLYVLAVGSVVFFVLQTRIEDEELEAKYGEEFDIYAAHVPGFDLFTGIYRHFTRE